MEHPSVCNNTVLVSYNIAFIVHTREPFRQTFITFAVIRFVQGVLLLKVPHQSHEEVW